MQANLEEYFTDHQNWFYQKTLLSRFTLVKMLLCHFFAMQWLKQVGYGSDISQCVLRDVWLRDTSLYQFTYQVFTLKTQLFQLTLLLRSYLSLDSW